MKLPWLRVYTEARTDAKLRSLTDRQHRVWLDLMLYSGEQPERGTIAGIPLKLVAIEAASGDVELLRETCNAMQVLLIVTCDLTDENSVTITFINFAERQHDKPSSQPARVRERVAKSRAAKGKGRQAKPKAIGNTDVTPGNAPVTPCNDEIRYREEKENTPPNPPQGGSPVVVAVDTEPFDQGNTELPPEPAPRVRNAPELVARVAATADRLFTGLDFGIKVRQLQADYDLAVLEAAMFDAHKATKTSWSYIVGIYAGRMRDGRGAGPATIRMAPMERPAIVHPVSVAPPDSKFRRHNAAADRAKFEAEVAELLAKEKLA